MCDNISNGQQRRQYTIKKKDTDGTAFIISYYLDGYKVATSDVPCYEVDSLLQTLNNKGYEYAQDLDSLFEKLENLVYEMEIIQSKITAALSDGNYVTRYNNEHCNN